MKITITKKYMVIPSNNDRPFKSVRFYENDSLVYDFYCRMDNVEPKFMAYVDVERFIGRTFNMQVEPYMECNFRFADEIDLPDLYKEPLRPRIHFTVPNGYTGDPNGLIYYQGKYHLFYQYNPISHKGGSNYQMHWGHAISDDLINWEDVGCALFPDELGAVFSGSAIEDVNNVTGLSKNGETPFLLYYTSAGSTSLISANKKRVQCMAYSNDGGKTFERFSGNPVVEHISGLNRDPKVVWVEEIKKFIMVIFYGPYFLLSSDDLIHWTKMHELDCGDKECPDIYPIFCDGEKKWIISGASDHYVVGHFTEDGFVAEGPAKRLVNGGTYATQSFSGINDGRVIRLWWEKHMIRDLDTRFTQQMGIPTSVKLEKINGEYYLSALPVEEISVLYKENISLKDHLLTEPIRADLAMEPLDITLKIPYVADQRIELLALGHGIVIDTSKNNVGIELERLMMPLSLNKDTIDVRIIIDVASVEIYADGGKFCMACPKVWDPNLPYIELKASSDIKVDEFTYHTMRSIHEKK